MSEDVRVAMVVLWGGRVPLIEAWVAELVEFGLPVADVLEAGLPTVQLADGAEVTLGHVPAPIPGPELAPLRGRSILWPGSEAAVDGHDGHLLVVVRGGDGDALTQRMHLTLATVATAVAAEAPGIYWGEVPHLTRTDIARQILADALAEGEIPVVLWVAVELAALPDGRNSALTRGLQASGHPELWLTSARRGPQVLWSEAMAIASYVASTGARLEPGQTLGEDEEDRHPIVAVPSPDGSGVEVRHIALA